MKKIVILLLCLAAVSAAGFFGLKQYQKSRDEKRVVDVVPVGAMAIPNYGYWGDDNSMYGVTNAANAQRVKLDTEKLVKNVCVKKGQQVKKGDVLLEYDMTVVELELAEKENDVQVIRQNIKMANNKLAELRNAQPSENAPKEPDPEIPDEPDFPDYPDIPEPVQLVEEVPAAFRAESGSGTPEDPIIINCSTRAKVYLPFMQMLLSTRRCVELRIYNDDFTFLYKWLLNGAKLKQEDAEDWLVTDGVSIDAETGSVSIDTEGRMHGQLSFGAPPQPEMPEEPEMSGQQMPEEQTDFNLTGPGSDLMPQQQEGMDYMYSRAELNRQIKEQETQIKELEINLKSAELKLATAQKQKMDGRVLAEIDGVVKKIGSVSDGIISENTSDNPDDPFAQPSEDDQYFAVIEGEGGMEVICQVMEMNLDKVQPGARLEINSYSDGAYSEAVVTSIDPEPVSYSYQGWGSNPNNSSYKVHAKIENSDDFMIGRYVSANLAGSSGGGQESNSIYIPAHYIRKEGGDYYVMKADENDRLVKQYISVGLTEYYVEVTGGLNMKDRICFPYGTNVKEGVKTNDTTEPIMPENMYY